MKIDLKNFQNRWYYPGPLYKRILWHIIGSIFINSYLMVPMALKKMILIAFGAKIGKGFVIKPKVNIKYPWFLEVGNYVWIGEEVWIDNFILVKISDNVCVSQGALLLTGNHNYKSKDFDLMIKPITIKEGAWVGAKSVVCQGVTMEEYSLLTVSSVATSSLNAFGIYQGNPAKFIRIREIN
jgi:putative colanic acid biosynthesis acetyltransferase WcaF